MKDKSKGKFYFKVKTLKQTPSLAQMEEKKLHELAGLSTFRHFNKGDFIFLEGEDLSCLYIVQDGRVKLFKSSLSGKSHTFSIAHLGDTLHGIVLFTGEPCWIAAQALDDVVLLCIGKKDFLTFTDRHPSILRKIIKILGDQINSTNLRLTDVISMDVKQRVVNVLNMLSNKFGSTLLFTNDELAELAGTTTETTIRVIGQLKRSGLISTYRGKIHIKDAPRLKDLSSDFIMI